MTDHEKRIVNDMENKAMREGLLNEVLYTFDGCIGNGCDVEQAAFNALYDWDIV